MILTLLQNLYFLVKKAFYPTIGAKRPFRRGKTPMAVSYLILRLNWYFFFRKILIPLAEKNNPVKSDILFDLYEYVSSRWAFCPTLVYTFHYGSRLIQFQRPTVWYFVPYFNLSCSPKVTYIFTKEDRYTIFKSNRSVGVLPRADNICCVYEAHYEVLRPSEHRLDFILQADSCIAVSSHSNMNCKKIFSQQQHKMFKFLLKSHKQTRFFKVSVDKGSFTLTYLFQ